MNPIVIDVGKQLEGYTFRLNPLTQQWLQEKYPKTDPVSSVYISFNSRDKMENLQSLMWPQILTLLTGLSETDKVDQFSVVNPVTGQEIYNSDNNYVQ